MIKNIYIFQGRSIVVKWQRKTSNPKSVIGGGPQKGLLWNLEFLGLSIENASCLHKVSRVNFVADLSIL